MIEKVLELARPAVREMAAYKSARSLGIQGSVFLDANESPWHPVTDEDSPKGLNRYPSPQPPELVAALASMYGVSEAQMTVGRGADDAIDWLVRTFCEAGKDEILICPPTYGMYEVAANLQGARLVKVPAPYKNEFAINSDAILKNVSPDTKLVFVCNPNNPTGTLTPATVLEQLADSLFGRALLVIDEAYIEFASVPSFTSRLSAFPNVVILRTLSKAWGLAGARCGTAIAHPEVTKLLQKVRAPYPISQPALETILSVLGNTEGAPKRIARTKEAKEKLSVALVQVAGVKRVFPSDANFILLETESSEAFLKRCLGAGIVVRDRSSDYSLRNCVRITVGSDRENRLLLEALQ